MPRNPDGTIPVGNWHDYLRLPWANPNNPTLINREKAMELIQATGLNARGWLCSLGARRPGIWMSAAAWAKCVAQLRWTHIFVPEADRRTTAGRTRSIEQVLDANLQETLVGKTRTEYVTMRLEKDVQPDSPPRYRFVVIDRCKCKAIV
jgi:hypothetical protein